MEIAPPLARDPRDRSLDAWRGVACLLVVIHHAGVGMPEPRSGPGGVAWLERLVALGIASANMGVPLFFVISGYCIAASADANRRKGAWSWAFMGRRVRRIFPPYWAALACFVGVSAGLDAIGRGDLYRGGPMTLGLHPFRNLTGPQWVGNLTLTETWRTLVWGHGKDIYTHVAWTLCYEEQFYFVTFLMLVFFPRRLFEALGVVTAVSAALRVAAYDSGALGRFDGLFPTLWHEFAVGVGVYWRVVLPGSPRTHRLLEAGLLALFVVGLLGSMPSTAQASAFGLVLIGSRWLGNRRPRVPGLGFWKACGRRCYSMYLTHMIVCPIVVVWLFQYGVCEFWPRVLVTVPAVVAGSIALAWGFFWLAERHFLGAPVVRRHPERPSSGDDAPLAGERAVEEPQNPQG